MYRPNFDFKSFVKSGSNLIYMPKKLVVPKQVVAPRLEEIWYSKQTKIKQIFAITKILTIFFITIPKNHEKLLTLNK